MPDIRWIGPFEVDEVTIGRNRDCTIVIDDPSVSREHARLRRHYDGWSLCDLGSANGTWTRGRRVKEVHLERGETFYVGDVALALTEPIATAASAARSPAPPARAASRAAAILVLAGIFMVSVACLAIAAAAWYWLAHP
jgi:predicted component of type VI protein secretion system